MPEQVDRPVAAMRSGDSLLLCSLCGRIVGNSSVLRQDGFGGCGYLSGILHRAVSRGPCRCVSGAGVRYEVLGLPRDSSLLWQVRVVPKIDVPGTTRTAGESDARFYGDAQQQRQCVDNQAVDRSDERHAQTAREQRECDGVSGCLDDLENGVKADHHTQHSEGAGQQSELLDPARRFPCAEEHGDQTEGECGHPAVAAFQVEIGR